MQYFIPVNIQQTNKRFNFGISLFGEYEKFEDMTKHSIDDEESVALVVIPSSSSCHIFVSALNPFYKDLSET